MITRSLRAQLGPPEEVARIFDAFEQFHREYSYGDPHARVTMELLKRYIAAAERRRAHQKTASPDHEPAA